LFKDEFLGRISLGESIHTTLTPSFFSIDLEANRIELTFRSGELKRNGSTLTLSDFEKGQIVDGVVKKVEDYGVFIQIKETRISGLCHKSEVYSSVIQC
jgi:rRNA biogenesis protein RRP5